MSVNHDVAGGYPFNKRKKGLHCNPLCVWRLKWQLSKSRRSLVYHQFRRNCISSTRSVVYHHCESEYNLRLMIYSLWRDIPVKADEIHANAWWYTIAFAMDKKIPSPKTWNFLAPPAGLEPATRAYRGAVYCRARRCSLTLVQNHATSAKFSPSGKLTVSLRSKRWVLSWCRYCSSPISSVIRKKAVLKRTAFLWLPLLGSNQRHHD